MDFINNPPPFDEIVVVNPINPRALRETYEEFLYGCDEIVGEFTEKHFLSMIHNIYYTPLHILWFFLPEREIAEKELEEAKVSLLRKTGKSHLSERLRQRIVSLLSIIEDKKFEKHTGLLAEILSRIDGEL